MKNITSIIGLVFLAASPLSLAQTLPDIAEELPAETLVYFEINDVAEFANGFETSSTGRIWNDPAVQDFLAPVLPMVDMGLAQGGMDLAAVGFPDNVLDLSQWGSFSLGWAIPNLNISNDGSESSIDAMLALSIKFKQAELASQVFEGIASNLSGEQTAVATSYGKEIIIAKDKESHTVACRLGGNEIQFVLSLGDGTSIGSLSEDKSFVTARNNNAEEVFYYMDVAQSVKLMKPLLESAPPSIASSIGDIFGLLGLDALGAIQINTGWDNGDSVMYGSFGVDSTKGGLISSSQATAPVDLSLLKYVPAEATSFSIATVKPEALWEILQMGVSVLDQMLAASDDEVAELSNLPLMAWVNGNKQDRLGELFGALGTRTFKWAATDAGSLMGGGGAGGSYMEVKDVDLARSVMTELFRDLENSSTPESVVTFRVKQLTIRERNEEGKWTTRKGPEYYEMRLNNLDLPGELAALSMLTAQFTPTWAITDDGWMVSASSSAPIRKALRDGVKANAENVMSNADVQGFLKRLPENANSASWSDPRPIVGGLVGMTQSMLPMITGAIPPEQIPVDLNKFPGPDAFTKHLRPTETWSVCDASGTKFQSVGSFGGGEATMLCLTAAAGGIAYFGVAKEMGETSHGTFDGEESFKIEASHGGVGEIQDSSQDLNEAETIDTILAVQGSIMVYQLELKGLPASLKDLSAPQPDWPDGFLATMGASPLDAWGKELVYILKGNGAYTLYSCGPDGVDNQGGGDDISVE